MESGWISNFDKSLRGLFKFSNAVLSKYQDTGFDVSGKLEMTKHEIRQFVDDYEMEDINIYRNLFNDLYKRYRLALIKGYRSDVWIKQKSIVLVQADKKFRMSEIYNYAIELREDAIRRMNKVPDEEPPRELIYPDAFMLHLYRILQEICENEEDKKVLSSHIKELENQLQIKKKETETTTTTTTGGLGGMGGILQTASKIFSGDGIDLPNGSKVNLDSIGKIISSVVNNPQIMDNLGPMFSKLIDGVKNGDDISQTFKDLSTSSLFSDPAIGQVLSNLTSTISDNGEGKDGKEEEED